MKLMSADLDVGRSDHIGAVSCLGWKPIIRPVAADVTMVTRPDRHKSRSQLHCDPVLCVKFEKMGLDRKPKSDNPVTEWIKSTSNLSSSTPEQADEINDGTALQLCDACLAALRVFSPHLSQSRQSRTGIVIFQEILIKLQLWRDGFGRGELEKVLARSRPIQNAILQHLIAISDALKYGEC